MVGLFGPAGVTLYLTEATSKSPAGTAMWSRPAKVRSYVAFSVELMSLMRSHRLCERSDVTLHGTDRVAVAPSGKNALIAASSQSIVLV
jgi:hypothetical protein